VIIQPGHTSLLYVPPFREESLTSWVFRLANAHYCDLQTYFGGRVDPKLLRLTDFDVNPGQLILQEIFRYTPILPIDLRFVTLSNPELYGFDKLIDRKFVPWLIPKARKTLHSFGLQICPSCWSNDKIAYHRIHWRLSLFFFCPECRVYLQDHCAVCEHPIVCFHPDIPKFKEDPLDALRYCFQCSNNLIGQSIPLSLKHEVVANRVLNLMSGKANLPCSIEDYLAVLHYFTQRAFSEYQRQTDLKYLIQTRDRSRFLEVNSILRADLLAKAFEIFDEFPDIITKTKRNHLSVKAFWLRGFVEPPRWYWLILKTMY
jgi:hypothetical protein